jgi:hypothetical protein
MNRRLRRHLIANDLAIPVKNACAMRRLGPHHLEARLRSVEGEDAGSRLSAAIQLRPG